MGGNGAFSGISAQGAPLPILSQNQTNSTSAGPIWLDFTFTTIVEPREVTWTAPTWFAENGDFFGLEYSSIPLGSTSCDGRLS